KEGDLLVGWVLPGPLEGTGKTSPYLQRGDIILEADGRKLDAKAFKEFVKTKRPGAVIRLKIRQTEGNVAAAVPTPGKGETVIEHDLVLAPKQRWTGPVFDDTPAGRTLPK